MQVQNLTAGWGLETVISGQNTRLVRIDDEYAGALARYGIEPAMVGDSPLVVEPGVNLALSATAPCGIFSRKLDTQDVDQFKAWIGVPDDLIVEGQYLAPKKFPSGIWSPSLEGARETLTDAQWSDLESATQYYLFGNSALVSQYRQAIVRHWAPFEAAVYAASRIEILPGASVCVTGYPAALIFREVVIHHGGAIKLYTPARMLVQHLLALESHERSR
jgi:hypothetical protein